MNSICFGLVGNGIHSKRYLETFLFSDLPYNWEICKTEETMLNKVNNLIICEPFYLENNTIVVPPQVERIFIEKLPFHSEDKFESFVKQSKSEIIVVHTRLYEQKSERIHKLSSNENTLIWPNSYHTNMNPFWNTIPNIFDWLCVQFSCQVEDIEISLINKKDDIITVVIHISKLKITIKIIPSNRNDCVVFNNTIVKWPSYIDLYQRAIKTHLNSRDNSSIIKHSIAEIALINKIMRLKGNEY